MARWTALIIGATCFLGVSSDAKEIDGPIATVDFDKGYDRGAGFGRATSQIFGLVDTKECSKFRQIGFVTALGSKRKARPIPAGQPVQIIAHTKRIESTAYGNCVNRVAFTPTIGGRYSIVQIAIIGQYCQMTVVDQSTGKAPPDLKHIDPKSCSQTDSQKGVS